MMTFRISTLCSGRYMQVIKSLDHHLTLTDPFISESCIEMKIELNFYVHTSLWCLKRVYEGL